MKIREEYKNPVKIGGVCIFTYLVSYVSRNVLRFVTPILTEKNLYTNSFLGMLATVYMFVYAMGQLFNGVFGERIRSKYMTFSGCMLAAIGLASFPLIKNSYANIISFALLGFGLSMIRGPLMKVIAENMKQKSAEIVCVLFSVSSFLGPVLVSIFSILLQWEMVFYVSALFAFLMAFISYFTISFFEKRGVIIFKAKKGNVFKGIKNLFFVKNFIFYIFVAAIVEIAASAISFWTPTYFSDYLNLSLAATSSVTSLVSFVNIFCPFLSIFIYHNLIKNDVKLVSVAFAFSAVFYIALIFTREITILNIVFFILSNVSIHCASPLLWSVYIPSLKKHGGVSAGNGIYDFTGYVAASLLNSFFSFGLDGLGWNSVIMSWSLISIIGFLCAMITIISNKAKNNNT